MIIDAHTHIGKWEAGEWTLDSLLESMVNAGIDYAIVIANAREGRGAEGLTIDAAVRLTEMSPKIFALGSAHFGKFDEQLPKLEAYLRESKIHGIKFYPGYEHFPPGDSELQPAYELCLKYDVPAVFHGGVLLGGLHGLLKYSHPLLIDELAEQFPDLKIVIAHAGNPWIADCAAVMEKNKNVYADCSGYFSDFTIPTAEGKDFFKRQFSDMRTYLGSFKKLIFGTDWPIDDQKEYVEVINQLSLTPEERDHVFWKNAVELFKLSVKL